MSGAEAIASLALGAAAIVSLFNTCIDCFNIVITARDFNQSYEVLCADLALQRLRFCLWGESVGLTSRNADEVPICHAGLDHPAVKPTVKQALRAIQLLLTDTDQLRSRFRSPSAGQQAPSHILSLFRETFTGSGRTRDQIRRKIWRA